MSTIAVPLVNAVKTYQKTVEGQACMHITLPFDAGKVPPTRHQYKTFAGSRQTRVPRTLATNAR